MRPRTEISAGPAGAIRRAMLAATTPSAFQRLQCLWLRTHEDLSTEAIARITGFSVSHVRRVWSDYLHGGLAAAQGLPKGGRRHQNLTVKQEAAVLAPLQNEARAGRLLTVRGIKTRYETRVAPRARLDGVSAAGPAPVATSHAAPQASQKQPCGPGRF